MDKMFSRLRSMSGAKLKSPTTPTAPDIPPGPPSKEDILTTLDAFGEKIQAPSAERPEDNNNVHVRRQSEVSENSVTSEWMEVAHTDTEPTITSITHSYSLEWEKLFLKQGYLRHLRNYSIKGNLRSSRYRSMAWKLFLEVMPEDPNAWINKTRQFRNKYTELRDRLIVNPRKAVDTVDLTFNNPLSQEEESPWNRFFLDNELRLTIKQDVIRTFPEIEFYHSEAVRDMMTNVLFCYSREHAALSYKQGMHELLAPMIFILHCDHQAFLHASEMESLDEKIKCVMDPKYLEHDAYAMFSQVMETMEPWYVSKEVYPTKPVDPTSSQPFARPQDLNPSNVIVTKLTRVQDYLLKKADHELHLHLERHEIAPQIYGIRWIRLLFGREFPMQDLLVLWDAIFADGIGFDLVDYIFVAMLLYLRDHLLSSDYPSCLITLMRYPPVGDIHYFIDKARHLRDPHQYPRPPTYTYQSVQTIERLQSQQEQKAINTSKSRSSSSTIHSLTRKIYTSSRPKSLSVAGRQKMSKSSSEPMNLQTEMSPVSPTPGTVPQHKRASSASLSQVEDSMFRSAPSSGSLARMETQSAGSASAVTTPDDVNVNGVNNPTKFSTLPARGKQKVKKIPPAVITDEEASRVNDIAALRGLVNDKESMCKYCASKLDHHIESLQGELLRQSLENEDDLLVAIAGIKQVRDVLKGTLRFSRNLLDEDEITINDNHYKMDVSTTSIESDHSPDIAVNGAARYDGETNTVVGKKRMFYMSSEENSEGIDSPSDPLSSTGAPNSGINFKLPLTRDYELGDVKNGGPNKQNRGEMMQSLGPNDCESEFSKSWSPESGRTDGSIDSDIEESPNPLYRIRHSSYDM